MWELLPAQVILADHLHCAVLGFPAQKGSRITGRTSEFCDIPSAGDEQVALNAPSERVLMAGVCEEGLWSQEKLVGGGQALDVHFSTRTRKLQGKLPLVGDSIKRNERRLVLALTVQLRNSSLQDGLSGNVTLINGREICLEILNT